MKKFYLPLLFLLIANSLFAQWDTPRLFPEADNSPNYNKNSLLIEDAAGNLHFFWLEYTLNSSSYYHSLSNDDGFTWSEKNIFSDSIFVVSTIENAFTGLVTPTGRILIVYKVRINVSFNYYMKFSDDNGLTWSSPISFPGASALYINSYSSKLMNFNNEIWMLYNKYDRAAFVKSTDDGNSWTSEEFIYQFDDNHLATSLHLFKANTKFILIYNYKKEDYNNIEMITSSDSGATWSEETIVLNSENRSRYFSAVQKNENEIEIFYSKVLETQFDSIFQSDIYSMSTTDAGLIWSEESKFTNFVGNDSHPDITKTDEDVYISFRSARNTGDNSFSIWYGKIDTTIDSSASPYIYNIQHVKGPDSLSIQITALIDDDTGLDSVLIDYSVNENILMPVQMFDDGLHNDSLDNDKIFGYRFANFENFDLLKFNIRASDDQSNQVSSEEKIFYFSSESTVSSALIDINNIKLPINNRGILADVFIPDYTNNGLHNGTYDGETFLFSGGFYMSGMANDNLWGNGILSASRIEDYQSGKINSDPNSPINQLYVVRSSDPAFGFAWQKWESAVSLGADFYDGNNNNIYDPVDLNYNGQWDANEDRPDFQGDITAWCVFNDGVPQSLRRYDIDPQGIEIKQTVFASGDTGNEFEDIIFVRYKIENNGTVADVFDSVYFGAAADPDLGESFDDLVGCDTLLNSGYLYNQGPDNDYGNNPPAFFIKQLQGPPVFIPGETFIDNNSDDEFTPGVDTPLDSAIVNNGKYLGTDFIPGAKNLKPNAYTQYMSSHPTNGDPDTHYHLRNYMLGGMGNNGGLLDPCTWQFGNGSSISNCSEINPKFMYSGDPVAGEGWINIEALDQRFILSSGPFKLKAGEPIELIYAYIVGRGTDHLNSITKAREISQFAQTVYDNNFVDLPTGIDDDENIIADEFKLYQNYPNPFNPTTTIKFQIPSNVKGQMANIKIIVFDILGREINTLLNEPKPAGTYEVEFNASKLASGVYFYQLSAGSFIQTKKLMLLK